jgi:hypothetical protein
MKKIIILSLLLLTSISIYAQKQVAEPDFIGESFLLNSDNSTINLEKETIQIKTKASILNYMGGIGALVGKTKSKINIQNCCSNSRTKTKNNLAIVIKAVDNETDPLAIISIFKFEQKGESRKAELASYSVVGGASENNLNYIKYTAKRYGKSSYIITISAIDAGEYGINVKNPNNKDDKSTIVSTFGVDN